MPQNKGGRELSYKTTSFYDARVCPNNMQIPVYDTDQAYIVPAAGLGSYWDMNAKGALFEFYKIIMRLLFAQ